MCVGACAWPSAWLVIRRDANISSPWMQVFPPVPLSSPHFLTSGDRADMGGPHPWDRDVLRARLDVSAALNDDDDDDDDDNGGGGGGDGSDGWW